jgi:hypothetical protein
MKYRGYTIYKDFISWVAYAGSNDNALRAWTTDQLRYLIDQELIHI